MGFIAIKVKIADREYPVRVEAEEEARIRTAARLVNERMKAYREQFGLDDKQDLLAMVAYDCLMDSLRTEAEAEKIAKVTTEQLAYFERLLDGALPGTQ